MFDLPFKLFPPALLAGLAIYVAVTMLWLQPLVESRWAEMELIPQCEVNLQHSENNTPLPDNPARYELQMMIEMYRQTGLDKLPYIKQIITMAEHKLQAMQPSRLRISAIEKSSICSCAVDKAFAKNHLQMTLHVASLRTHHPASIKAINQTAITSAKSGICGALPWKG